MAELVYAFDLKSNGEIHMGSSPISGTNKMTSKNAVIFYLKIIISSGNKPRIIKKAPKRYFFRNVFYPADYSSGKYRHNDANSVDESFITLL